MNSDCSRRQSRAAIFLLLVLMAHSHHAVAQNGLQSATRELWLQGALAYRAENYLPIDIVKMEQRECGPIGVAEQRSNLGGDTLRVLCRTYITPCEAGEHAEAISHYQANFLSGDGHGPNIQSYQATATVRLELAGDDSTKATAMLLYNPPGTQPLHKEWSLSTSRDRPQASLEQSMELIGDVSWGLMESSLEVWVTAWGRGSVGTVAEAVVEVSLTQSEAFVGVEGASWAAVKRLYR